MRRQATFVLLAIALLPRAGWAQERLVEKPAFYLGFNAIIGGGAAAAHALLADADVPPLRAFLQGAMGGVVMYGGQRLVGTGVPALRLPGVQTVAVGASMARNAGAGVPLFSTITLPVYPFYLQLRPGSDRPFGLRVSAAAAASLASALTRNGSFQAEIDWRESLLTGAPVFRSASSWIYPFGDPAAAECRHGDGCDGGAGGLHRVGTTWYTTGGRSAEQSARILTHETIHLTQVVRDALLFGIPASDALTRAAGGFIERAGRFIVFDGFLPLTVVNHGLSLGLPHTDDGNTWRLYEFEAHTLGTGR
jgi:hypothetical protein